MIAHDIIDYFNQLPFGGLNVIELISLLLTINAIDFHDKNKILFGMKTGGEG